MSSRKKVTCIHSKLNTACQMQVASRCLTVCSRRIRSFHTVKTSATYVGLSNLFEIKVGESFSLTFIYRFSPCVLSRITGAEFYLFGCWLVKFLISKKPSEKSLKRKITLTATCRSKRDFIGSRLFEQPLVWTLKPLKNLLFRSVILQLLQF